MHYIFRSGPHCLMLKETSHRFRRMSTSPSPLIQKADLDSFTLHLKASNHIVALLGAGLSASSGLPTFRGTGGLWRNHDATMLATPEAFAADPGLVWQFYSYRRHMALKAQPNKAHYALAELAKRRENFLTLSQNVDGMRIRFRRSTPEKVPFVAKLSIRAQSAGWPSGFEVASAAWLVVRRKMYMVLL